MFVDLTLSFERISAEADIAFGEHFDDAGDGLAFGVAEGVEAISADEVEEEVGEIFLRFGGVARTDMVVELLIDELSHHLVKGMVLTDSCHLFS